MDSDHDQTVAPAKRAGRLRRLKRRIFRVPTTGRGMAGMVLAFSCTFGAVVGFTMWFVKFSEGPVFCTSCHTMQPEKKAYHEGIHRDVACGECHVAPGMKGWVTAKIGGMHELYALVTDTFPRPILAPEHGAHTVPSPTLTCARCHSLADIDKPGNPVTVKVTTHFQPDATNTRQVIALTLRPPGLVTKNVSTDDVSAVEGVHSHLTDGYQIFAKDEFTQTIPLVEYQTKDGKTVDFISRELITMPENAKSDIQQAKASLIKGRSMDCIDCHNRIGHDIPTAETKVDQAMATGTISPSLPFIKRDAVTVIEADYPTAETADTAIDRWSAKYATDNGISGDAVATLTTATVEIKRIYHLITTPHMRATAAKYYNNMGHQNGPGCFRCHDGAHIKVVDGVATGERIASSCSTCHTYPQQGKTAALQLGGAPASHADKMWVFNHKSAVASVAAAFATPNASCASCHTQSTCLSCHSTAAGQLNHDNMLYRHATSLQQTEAATCASCHQNRFCSTCHSGDMLPVNPATAIKQPAA